MTQRSMFFDSSSGDRIYTSDSWSQIFGRIFSDGVVSGYASGMAVAASGPAAMSVVVPLGSLWVQGRFLDVYTSNETLTVLTSDPTNPRIDRIVARIDYTGRTLALAVLKGTAAASPVAPTLTQNTTTWEMSLAKIAVAAGATSIVTANITDERTFVTNAAAIAFGKVVVGASTIASTAAGDTLNMVAGSGVTLTPNVGTKTVTVAVTANSVDAATLDGIDSTGFALAAHNHDTIYPRTNGSNNVGTFAVKSGGDAIVQIWSNDYAFRPLLDFIQGTPINGVYDARIELDTTGTTDGGGLNVIANSGLKVNSVAVARIVSGDKITVASSAPGSPATGDIWIDTSVVL